MYKAVSLTIILSFLIVGCSSTKKINNYESYAKECVIAFTYATNEFFNKDYKKAKELLINYSKLDSSDYDYEKYAFLAECYSKLGKQDSGQIVYQNVIHEMKKEIKEDPQRSSNTILWEKDLEKWYSNYPNFPNELRRSNGFIPYDDFPNPIGGINGIQKYLVYPIMPDGQQKEGTVYVLTLISKTGKPIDYKIIKSIGKPYDVAATNAISRARFTVPKRKGRPYEIWVGIPIVFKLE